MSPFLEYLNKFSILNRIKNLIRVNAQKNCFKMFYFGFCRVSYAPIFVASSMTELLKWRFITNCSRLTVNLLPSIKSNAADSFSNNGSRKSILFCDLEALEYETE